MAFTLSGDVATTRTNLGLGDAATKTTGTASGNIPVLDGSGQIASGVLTNAVPADDSITLAKMASGTDGNLITYDASGNPAYVTTGTSGQVLTSTGAGSAPTMQDAAAGGKVLQVVQAVKTDTGSWSGTWQTISGWAATITPSSTTSKILVSINVGSATPISTRNSLGFRIMRDSTPIGIGDTNVSAPQLTFRTTRSVTDANHSDGGFQTQVLDSPTIPGTPVAITYTLQGQAEANDTFYVNRNQANCSSSNIYCGTSHSSIILMEIGA